MLHDLIARVDGRIIIVDGEGVEVAADAVAGADFGVFFVVFVELDNPCKQSNAKQLNVRTERTM